ncbi:hypothetical protein MMC06_001523 [Schaereria dolodes]|nr:hypothetical protein [Schaereria dolodes]
MATTPITTPITATATATAYLQSLLNKQLRIHTTDTRMFVGEFKCTDNDLNIILSRTHEYRLPSSSTLLQSLPSATTPTTTTASNSPANDDKPPSTSPHTNTSASTATSSSSNTTNSIKADMTSRFLGLVVVPGRHVVRIEVEE